VTSCSDTNDVFVETDLSTESEQIIDATSEDLMMTDAIIWSECDEKDSLGVIKGVSGAILICEETDGGLEWREGSQDMALTAGDSCFDGDNSQPMRSDGKSFATRIICVNGTFETYPPVDKSEYLEVSERELKMLLKNLPENVGKQIVVYGNIFGMGNEQIQAYVSFKNHKDSYDYGFDDAIFIAETELTRDLVTDDEFKAWVRIRPHTTFDTQIGGKRTTPYLRVDAIERIN